MYVTSRSHTVIETFREICKKILYSSLGESSGEAVLFFLRKGLSKDPFEVLWNNPKAFYREMEKVFGIGANVIINLLVTKINNEFGLSMSFEHFLELIRSNDQQSIKEIRSFITEIVKLHRRKKVGAK